MLLRLPKHDLHRERCSRCGKVFLTIVDENYWHIPISKRPSLLCPVCKLEDAKYWVGSVFERKKRK